MAKIGGQLAITHNKTRCCIDRQQPRQVIDRQTGNLHAANALLQHPIPAQRRRTGRIIRSRHIRPGGLRQRRNKRRPFCPRRHIAAIQQNIPASVQRSPNVGKLRPIRRQIPAIKHRAAQNQRPLTAMRNDMNRPNTAAPGQPGRHLPQPVRLPVQHKHLRRVGQTVDQGCIVANARVNENNGFGGHKKSKLSEMKRKVKN